LASRQSAKKTETGTKTKKKAPFGDIFENTTWKALTTIIKIVAGPSTEENINPAENTEHGKHQTG
jgi:hypothetical protein